MEFIARGVPIKLLQKLESPQRNTTIPEEESFPILGKLSSSKELGISNRARVKGSTWKSNRESTKKELLSHRSLCVEKAFLVQSVSRNTLKKEYSNSSEIAMSKRKIKYFTEQFQALSKMSKTFLKDPEIPRESLDKSVGCDTADFNDTQESRGIYVSKHRIIIPSIVKDESSDLLSSKKVAEISKIQHSFPVRKPAPPDDKAKTYYRIKRFN